MHPNRPIVIASALALVAGSAFAGDTPLSSELVAGGVGQPVMVTHAPNDLTRIFVVNRFGRVYVIKNDVLLPVPFLDLFGQVSTDVERGVLGLAFHPDFERNNSFYVRYNNTAGTHILERYEISASNPDVADESTAQLVFSLDNQNANHNGGWIEFGPLDGYLYTSIGEDGHAEYAQDLDKLHGKILRIDVDSGDAFPGDPTRNYAIPPDNPFVGVPGVMQEIWAWGLRNPWRCSFDRGTGDLYVADVGNTQWEEVNVIPAGSRAGGNFGWPCMEAGHCFTFFPIQCICGDASLTISIFEYGHDAGCAISGGGVYRGSAIQGLQGSYFFADFCSERIWSFRYVDGEALYLQERTAELDPPGPLAINFISGFGEDAAGELYVCDLNGEVFRIIPDPSVPAPPPGFCVWPDLNDDGLVNGFDLALLLGQWGPCKNPDDCAADMNCSNVVNGIDLALMLGVWGSLER